MPVHDEICARFIKCVHNYIFWYPVSEHNTILCPMPYYLCVELKNSIKQIKEIKLCSPTQKIPFKGTRKGLENQKITF